MEINHSFCLLTQKSNPTAAELPLCLRESSAQLRSEAPESWKSAANVQCPLALFALRLCPTSSNLATLSHSAPPIQHWATQMWVPPGHNLGIPRLHLHKKWHEKTSTESWKLKTNTLFFFMFFHVFSHQIGCCFNHVCMSAAMWQLASSPDNPKGHQDHQVVIASRWFSEAISLDGTYLQHLWRLFLGLTSKTVWMTMGFQKPCQKQLHWSSSSFSIRWALEFKTLYTFCRTEFG